MTQPLYRRLSRLLQPTGEARALAMALLQDAASLTMADVLAGKADDLPVADQERLTAMAERIAGGEPVQYVVGWQRFCGLRIAVSPGVLIPRPETEALVTWAIDLLRPFPQPAVLDIGTGSGCIALALKRAFPQASIEAWDVSPETLAIAHRNAERLALPITFRQVDLLDDSIEEIDGQRGEFLDGIISNPPYVCLSERAEMEANVLCHEPSVALFVPDDDPFLFYRPIAHYAQQHLRSGGYVLVEINRRFGPDVINLFRRYGFENPVLRDDPFGLPRMVCARKCS